MKLKIISFTEKGMRLGEQIHAMQSRLTSVEEIQTFTKWSGALHKENSVISHYEKQRIGDWAGAQMQEKHALLFLGACGIAVRAIAPHIVDKLCDSPVLVMDELGRYVIPILSGHVGGANELAQELADCTGAIPVITTATDINGKFAADLFAKKNGLAIMNKNGIAKISSKILAGKRVLVSIETGHCNGVVDSGCESVVLPDGLELLPYPPTQPVDILITSENQTFDAQLLLKPKRYAVGMGCRKGKKVQDVQCLIEKILRENGISIKEIFALASIDVKADENCFLSWSRENQVPFMTFSADELRQIEGDFHASEFVKNQVGVDNVCERAALRVCDDTGRIIVEKYAENGMTIAVAKRDWSVRFDEA